MQVFDFILSDEDMRLIESINKSWRALIPMKEVSGTVPSFPTLSSLSNSSLPRFSLFYSITHHSLTLPVLHTETAKHSETWVVHPAPYQTLGHTFTLKLPLMAVAWFVGSYHPYGILISFHWFLPPQGLWNTLIDLPPPLKIIYRYPVWIYINR